MKIDQVDIPGYERVMHATDASCGLNAFISVHDTTLGPALGGMRMWPYASEAEALTDVLRLSEGMTYKSAIARTGLGGGKSVIIGEPKQLKTPALLQAMGRFIDTLAGSYITAEDVNIRESDLEEVRKATRWVTGLSRAKGGSGNPSPYTAKGVVRGIHVCLHQVYGSASAKGRRFAVQGAGSVAQGIMEDLVAEGAVVTTCDINEERVARLRQSLPTVRWVAPEAIFDIECDVFSPNALGAILNDRTIPQLRCKIVAGAANNQLAEPRHGDVLKARGILFAPDFVINAGGIINVGCELLPEGYVEADALARIANIDTALKQVFEESDRTRVSTGEAAVAVAKRILAAGKDARPQK